MEAGYSGSASIPIEKNAVLARAFMEKRGV